MTMETLRVSVPATTSPRSSTSTPTTPSTPGKARELAPFLRQLREMLDHESPSILRWTPDGRAFEILDLHQMTHVVLPKYFKHCKYASFQRQLNYFHFRKWTKSKSPLCTFANPFFVREAPELTWHIVRKRDLSSKKKRPRAQSLDPLAPPQEPTAPRSPQNLARTRAASDSVSLNEGDAQGLLQWIDDQFPSIASIQLLDDANLDGLPVWTPYQYQTQASSYHPYATST